jgi:hypothetical protein
MQTNRLRESQQEAALRKEDDPRGLFVSSASPRVFQFDIAAWGPPDARGKLY